MKHLRLILLTVVSTVTFGCSVHDYTKSKKRIRHIESLVSEGDNIHAARAKLRGAGYHPTPVTSGKPSMFHVQITDYTLSDQLSFLAQKNLNPWRNRIPYHVLFRAKNGTLIDEIDVH